MTMPSNCRDKPADRKDHAASQYASPVADASPVLASHRGWCRQLGHAGAAVVASAEALGGNASNEETGSAAEADTISGEGQEAFQDALNEGVSREEATFRAQDSEEEALAAEQSLEPLKLSVGLDILGAGEERTSLDEQILARIHIEPGDVSG